MASSRKDTRGYVLRTGECQRSDGTDGVMAEIKKSHMWEHKKRHALTIPQQRAFTEFITDNKEYCGWYPVIMVLLGTGMKFLCWTSVDIDGQGTFQVMDVVD